MNPGGIMSDVTIPEDIRQKVEAMFDMAAAAETVDDATGLPLVEAADAMTMVGRLVLAERERCAKIAWMNGWKSPDEIAQAIRSSHE